jgi:hypothetical protein
LPCGKRAPCRARSPVGVPRRLFPWDSRIPRCNPDQVSRSRRLSMAGVSRRRPPRFQRAPRMPVIMPADMMSEPPECRGDEPFARRHRNPLRRPESPAAVLSSKRDKTLLVRWAVRVQDIPFARAICLIRRDIFFAVCLMHGAAIVALSP